MLALIPVKSASDLEAEARAASDVQNQQLVIQGLAAHCRKRWEVVRVSQRMVQERMLDNVRRRRLEYTPEKLGEIRRQGGSEIYMGLASTKCRAATSWLRDSLLGTGSDKPWSLDATPMPELPPEVISGLQRGMMENLMSLMQAGQQVPDDAQLKQVASVMKDAAMRQLKEEAEARMNRMEQKMEDQLIEGGFIQAMSEFLDDLATFPFACLKGPVVRRRKTMAWENGQLVSSEELRPEWERVDPFYIYWAPWANNIQDGYVIERHRLTREDLEALIGVNGYSEAAIRTVLNEYDTGSLHEWLWVDTAKVQAEGKYSSAVSEAHKDLIEALQVWDSIPGRMLIEWGMDEADIEDPTLTYPCEVWLVGNMVVKATLNYDPLGRKPYYLTSYEKSPGSVDGNGVVDLVGDVEDMCNAAARALSNNMGISSGPMVGLNISRLPAGEDVTQLYPWKIMQFVSSDYGDNSAPLSFFQPNSNAHELLSVYERFASMADEVSGIPRYMTGEHVPGAGRTSSGLSMLISNAGKSIKQVINNIDKDVVVPIIERLFQYNQRYHQGADLFGDVKCVPKGAMSLVVKEAEAARRNEFLQLALTNPMAQQIMGMGGVAELLRGAVKNLAGNVDRIVPDRQYVGALEAAQAQIQQLTAMIQQQQAAVDPSGSARPQQQAAPQSLNLQADGSEQGGRAANYVSPRPNGV